MECLIQSVQTDIWRAIMTVAWSEVQHTYTTVALQQLPKVLWSKS